MSVCVDHGVQLEQYRPPANRCCTRSLPALVVESDQNIIGLTHIKPDLLEAVVGVKECSVELLEVASIIQLEDHQLVDEVRSVFVEEAKQAKPIKQMCME